MSTTVRICVCGDDGTGKSSLIVSLVKDTFITQNIQRVLPPVTIPPYPGIPEDVVTTIVDTSARPQDRTTLCREIRKCNVILLVYSSSYSFERVALFWLPYFRSLCVNVPVVLCANKSDLQGDGNTMIQVAKDEMLPVMNEFKEIDSCIRTSAREPRNVAEVFYLCQKAVTNPIGPLFDHKKGVLKANCVTALKRIFYLSDKDQDGLLGDAEMQEFQRRCFGKPLTPEELASIKAAISKTLPNGNVSYERGIDIDAFLRLNKIYVENGRHETIWTVLRKYRYSDSLSLEEKFVRPRFDVPPFASAELSPAGYRFLVDLFLLFDKDNDGGLNDEELSALFRPTPGIPDLWSGDDSSSGVAFPRTTVRNESGHVTLQGWLAQWSMSTFLQPKTTLEYLAYLGFGDPDEKEPTSAALKVTKPRKRTRRVGKVERTVVLCYLVGKSYSGKSSLLNAFLNRPFDTLYNPTREVRRAVNSVELPGGRQCYLILEELGPFESATLDNQAKLDACDLICFTYDSSDPDSFAHVVSQSARHGKKLDGIPAVFAALKADRDKSVQNSPLQPDVYTTSLGMSAPRHVSVTWDNISELFVALAETATNPSLGLPKLEDGADSDRTGLYMAAGAATAAAAAAVFMVWRRVTIGS